MFTVTALESDLLSSLNLGSTAVFRLGSLGVLVSSVTTVHLVWVSRTSSNMEVQDHYKVLGTTIGATTSKIKAACTKLIRMHHPDKANVYVYDAEIYRRVQLEIEVLTSATTRIEYDTLLSQRPSPGGTNQKVIKA